MNYDLSDQPARMGGASGHSSQVMIQWNTPAANKCVRISVKVAITVTRITCHHRPIIPRPIPAARKTSRYPTGPTYAAYRQN